jgi:hypothetical protein
MLTFAIQKKHHKTLETIAKLIKYSGDINCQTREEIERSGAD